MLPFLYKLWLFLAGGLLGWLLCGLMARRLKFGEAYEQQQLIDGQLARERLLERVSKDPTLSGSVDETASEIEQLKARLAELQSAAEPDAEGTADVAPVSGDAADAQARISEPGAEHKGGDIPEQSSSDGVVKTRKKAREEGDK